MTCGTSHKVAVRWDPKSAKLCAIGNHDKHLSSSVMRSLSLTASELFIGASKGMHTPLGVPVDPEEYWMTEPIVLVDGSAPDCARCVNRSLSPCDSLISTGFSPRNCSTSSLHICSDARMMGCKSWEITERSICGSFLPSQVSASGTMTTVDSDARVDQNPLM